MALVNDLVEMALYGDPDSVYELASGASGAEQAAALAVVKRRLESYGYSNQVEREALRLAESALSKGDDGPGMIFSAAGGGMSTITKVALGAGSLAAVWYFFIRK